MTTTLLSHLAARFASSEENLASEGLCYVLQRSSAARAAVAGVLSSAGLAVTSTLTYSTQSSGEDSGIPDIAGCGADGAPVLLIEAKFWAGLTDNQPTTYLRRLAAAGPGRCLLFLAPADRLVTLWPELTKRASEAGFSVQDTRFVSSECLIAPVGDMALGFVSWRYLLATIVTALQAANERDLVEDVKQLQGLADRMDTFGFLPLRSEELTGPTGLRLLQYCQLIDDVTQQLVGSGYASVDGLRASASRGWYGRYLRLRGYGCCLQLCASKWSALAPTPLWLSVKTHEWKHGPELFHSLAPLFAASPQSLHDFGEEAFVAVHLPRQVERPAVLSDIYSQLQRVGDALPRLSQ